MLDINTCPVCLLVPLEETKDVSSIHWILCDICNQWFHTICIKLTNYDVNNLSAYHCDSCRKGHGPSIYKRKSKRARTQIDYVALNEGEVFVVDKTFHPHVRNFEMFGDDELGNQRSEFLDTLKTITKDYALSSRLVRPVLIPRAYSDDAGMKLPRPRKEITIDYITNLVGEDSRVEVMDVLSQQSVTPAWNMGKWRDYFNLDQSSRDRIRNVISLEISQVQELGDGFHRPRLVREMDLVDKIWSDEKNERPQVTKYCLMSVKGSFTDFHIDFGGTSVYYTVCSGSKTFLMYPPTDWNLELYTSWCLEPNQNFLWFGDYSKYIKGKRVTPSNGFKVTLREGDVFFIPSGWIHAVYTPQDSIVIGGNFLTLMNIEMQLKISNIEKVTKVPTKFRFPYFNKVMWMTSWYYYNHKDEFIRDVNGTDNNKIERQSDHIERIDSIEYSILTALISHLKSHFELSKTILAAKRSIPTDLFGKHVNDYLLQLEEWLNNIKDDTKLL
ncbi:uncharacterized protein PRCAT00003688001 [Priceomyces carsonii]|uniref:uncharacterized protein n=1 Tax=Priceomyces carsonii TaxID=28549 RepID=UPI002ED9C261|nr:unnamed protein product [Priceomyces carsonii]